MKQATALPKPGPDPHRNHAAPSGAPRAQDPPAVEKLDTQDTDALKSAIEERDKIIEGLRGELAAVTESRDAAVAELVRLDEAAKELLDTEAEEE